MLKWFKHSSVIVVLVLVGCKPGELKHERYLTNNTFDDTIVFVNPDFDDVSDTLVPGERGLIYEYTAQQIRDGAESCGWQGDTLFIENLSGDPLNRSVKEESNWTYTLMGEKNKIQECTFVIISADFE